MVETLIIGCIGILSTAILLRRLGRWLGPNANSQNDLSKMDQYDKREMCNGSCDTCRRSQTRQS